MGNYQIVSKAKRSAGTGLGLSDAFVHSAAASGESVGLTHVLAEDQEWFESYGKLLERARRVLAGLRQAGLIAGDHVLIQCEDSRDFVSAFWGSLLGGFVPVPLSVPARYLAADPNFRKFRGVFQTLRAPCVILGRGLRIEAAVMEALESKDSRWLSSEALASCPIDDVHHTAKSDERALLMFSSGSTGTPKGVVLTHGNLLHNIAQIAERSALTPDDVAVSWLPYSHDMGLVLMHLVQATLGIPQVKLSSVSFMREPMSFLSALSKHRATLTGIPNFGYEHLLHATPSEAVAELDLSSVRLIYNGAEPISARTCREFLAHFAPAGLSASVLSPGYGLAEACVTATQHVWGSAQASAVCPTLRLDRRELFERQQAVDAEAGAPFAEFVDLGPPMPAMDIRIVDEAGAVLADGGVGRVQIRGPNVCSAYHGASEDTAQAFHAGWLSPGDLGFMRGGRLVITGREKDVIFVNGQKFYSHDVENTLVESKVARLGRCAVVGFRTTPDASESVAVFLVRSQKGDGFADVARDVRRRLGENFGFRIDHVLGVAAIPRTSSGKLRRLELRAKLESGEFDQLIRVSQVEEAREQQAGVCDSALEERILEVCTRIFRRPAAEIREAASFLDLGLDSINLVRLVPALRAAKVSPAVKHLLPRDLYKRHNVRELARYLEAGAEAATGAQAGIPRAVGSSFELAYNQKLIWLDHKLNPGTNKYNESRLIQLKPGVDADLLAEGLSCLVERHAALRTSFSESTGGPRQQVAEHLEPSIRVTDLALLEPAAFQIEALHVAEHDARMPFDLSQAPLCRFIILRGPNRSTQLSINFHHVIVDGASVALLLAELEEIYDKLQRGEAVDTGERLRSVDYYAWQAKRVQDASHSEAVSYWREVLHERPKGAALLPTAADADGTSGQAVVYRGLLEQAFVSRLQAYATANGITTFQLSLAAFMVFVGKICGVNDVTVGTSVDGREHEESLPLVGYLANLCPIRLDSSSTPTLKDVASVIRKQVEFGRHHQQYPFGQLTKELEITSELLFSTALSVIDRDHVGPLGVLELEHTVVRGATKLPLLVNIERGADWVLQWEFDGSKQSPRLVAEWHLLLRQILEAFVSDDGVAVAASHLSAAELQRVIEPNAHANVEPRLPSVAAYFEEAAGLHADAIALACDQSRLSYRELEQRTRHLAGHLRSLGAKPGKFVALALNKGSNMVVAVLAVLRSGAAYVPLDPELPIARLTAMAVAADVCMVLGDETSVELCRALGVVKRAKWLTPFAAFDALPADAEQRRPDTDARDWASFACPRELGVCYSLDMPVYVHFTSGSTGTPKGVVNTQRSVCSLIDWYAAEEIYTARDVVAQLPSFGFEAAVGEVLPALALGARLQVLPSLRVCSPGELLERLVEQQASVITITPSYLSRVLDHLDESRRARWHRLRRVVLAGEATLPSQVATFQAKLGREVEFANAYGPTEATVHSTYYRIPQLVDSVCSEVAIGRPILGRALWLLDSAGRHSEPGTVGEIWIGGSGLARGYLGESRATEERFKLLCLRRAEPERVYGTGDFARLGEDGNLYFRGRADTQVKVLGNRVEVGEIEAVASQHPGVKEVAVVPHVRADGVQLVAFYVPVDDGLSEASLIEFLMARLPAYMVPMRWQRERELPQSENGKIERRALMTKSISLTEKQEVKPVAGSSTLALEFAAVMATVLKRTSINPEANFFAEGGDSILTLEFTAELSRRGYALGPADVFKYRTPIALAEVARPKSEEPAAVNEPVQGAVSLTPIQSWFFQQEFEDTNRWLQSVELEIDECVDVPALELALRDVVAHHDTLRTSFRINRLGISQSVRLPTSDLLLEREDFSELANAAREAARAAFSARLRASIQTSGRLLAVGLARCSEQRWHLVWAIHHLIVDSVSWRILLGDLALAYRARHAGFAPDLGAKTVAYQRHADELDRQGDWTANGAALNAELDFWTRSVLCVEGWRPSGGTGQKPFKVSTFHTQSAACAANVSQALLTNANTAYGTKTQDLLHAALFLGLSDFSHEQRFVIDIEHHGRSQESGALDVSRTVGWFTSVFPLAVQLSDAPAIAETIVSLKEALAATPQQGRGFGLLRYICAEDKVARAFDAYRDPEITFNYLGRLASTDAGWRQISATSSDFAPTRNGPYAVVVQAYIEDSRLVWQVSASREVMSEEAAGELLNYLIARSERIAEHCALQSARVLTPSDFKRVALSAAEVNALPSSTVDVCVLTPMQQAMLFHCTTNPDTPMYHEQTVYRVGRVLEAGLLARALKETIRAHEVLRTIFVHEGFSQPLQVVLDEVAVGLEVATLSGDDSASRTLAMERLLEAARSQPFSLETGPLLRCQLLDCSALDECFVVISFHHIILDGWSQAVLSRELFERYEALESGKESGIRAPRTRFADVIERLAQHGEDPASRQFWQDATLDFTHNQLPRDGSRAGQVVVPAVCASRVIDVAVRERLTRLAATLGVTLNEVCLSAYLYLLHQLTGDSDVATGVVSSTRPSDLPDFDRVLGCLLNTLPVRVVFDEESITFAQLIQQVSDFARGAKQHEHFPLKEIVKGMRGREQRRSGWEPFSTIYAFENYPTRQGSMPVDLIAGYDMTNYDLTAVVGVSPKELRVMFEYAPDLFAPATLERWLEQYEMLLRELSEQPNEIIHCLDLLPERHASLLQDYNRTARDYPLQHSIQKLFSDQAARTPHRVAVFCAGEEISYETLNRNSNQVSRALRSLGVEGNAMVACMLYRSAAATWGFMGVLKSGGAYVPIDPSYPVERRMHIVERAGARVLVTDARCLREGLIPRALIEAGVRVLCVDAVDAELGGAMDSQRVCSPDTWSSLDPTDPLVPVDPEDVAYVIFTSGSTGTPKGVVIRQASAVNTIFGVNETFGILPSDKVLCFSSFCFDLSVYDLFGPLAVGAEVTLATEAQIRNAELLIDLVDERSVTVWDSVPTGMNQLVRTLQVTQPTRTNGSVRLVLLSGEFIPLQLPNEIRRVFRATKISSLGGATEGTVWSIFFCPVEEVREHWRSIPYGRPLPNQGYYVLNSRMKPCLIDQAGMLYITGRGVAQGYFQDPEKSAASFVPDPFPGKQGQIIYKTGDLGRMKADGNIEIIGRRDCQVKVRGYRIELGEVETQLGLHDEVTEAAVMAEDAGEGHKKLVAYFTATHALAFEEVAAFLKLKLPEYMIPTSFVQVDAMPVNASGKLDRKALARIAQGQRPKLSIEFEAPLPGAETSIAQVWCQVLNVERVGRHDNYFSLGGDSILSLRVATGLRARGYQMKPGDIFDAPSVSELAPLLRSTGRRENDSSPTLAPLAPIQRWLLKHDSAQNAEDVWSLDLAVQTRVDESKLSRVLSRIVARHPTLSSRITFQAGQALVTPVEAFQVAREDVGEAGSAAQQRAVDRLAAALRQQISLESGVPMRVGLLDLGQSQRIIWVAHRAVVDRESWAILLRELALGLRDEAKLGELAVPANDFLSWSENLAQRCAGQDDGQGGRALPAEEQQGGKATSLRRHSGALSTTRRVLLSRAETRALLGWANKRYHSTPGELLVTALAICLARAVGGGAVGFDVAHSLRSLLDETLDMRESVGAFDRIAPLALELAVPAAIGASVQHVRERLRALHELAEAPGAVVPDDGLLFDFCGSLDDLGLSKDWRVEAASWAPGVPWTHAGALTTYVEDGQLHGVFAHREGASSGDLLAAYHSALVELLAHCSNLSEVEHQAVDFPLLNLDAQQLRSLPADIVDAYPLTAMQEGMFYHTKAYPSAPLYHMHASALIKSDFDVPLLEQALNLLAEVYPLLRTAILDAGFSRPIQVVYREVKYTLPCTDIRDDAEEVQEQKIEAMLEDCIRAGFDLARVPNIKISLYRRADDVYQVTLVYHHLLLDGWSNATFVSELLSVYNELLGGRMPRLPVLKGSFRDFVQSELAQREDTQAQCFWREELAGATLNELPLDRVRASQRSFRTTIEVFFLEKALSKRVRELARSSGVTLSELLLATHIELVRRLTGDEDVTVAYNAAIRSREISDIDRLTGMFLNTVPVRVRFQPGGDLIDVVRQALRKVRRYQGYPLTELVKQADSEVRSRGTLFRSMFTAENYPAPELPSNIQGSAFFNWHTTEFDLAIVLSEMRSSSARSDADDPIILKFGFADDILSQETVWGWFQLFKGILEELCEPSSTLGDAAKAASTNAALVPEIPSFSELFAQAVRRSPSAPALRYRGYSLTYAELEAQVQKLSMVLSVLPSDASVVLAFQERSPLAIASMLACLSCGRAFVPVDPRQADLWPALERMPYAAAALLTDDPSALAREVHERIDVVLLVSSTGTEVVTGAERLEELQRFAGTEPKRGHVAYAMQTSGSTGEPKWVPVSQLELSKFLAWYTAEIALSASERVSQVLPLGFDACLSEILPTLAAGAELVLLPELHRCTPRELLRAVTAERIHVLTLPAHYFELLVDARRDLARDQPKPNQLRAVMVGGSPLSVASVCAFRASKLARAALFNVYGLTEGVIASSVSRCDQLSTRELARFKTMPIGKQCDTSNVAVLRPDMKPCRGGELGEVYLLGPGLSEPALNVNPTRRMFATGDLAKVHADGTFELVGRRDRSVKVRGQRVSLVGVESVLCSIEGVVAAAALALGSIDGGRLVAFVAVGSGTVSAADVAARLKGRVSEAFTPSQIIVLNQLPLDARGKLDQACLLAMVTSDPAESGRGRGDLRGLVRRLFEQVLGKNDFDDDQHFLDLGGVSVGALRVVSALEEGHASLSVQEFLRAGSVSSVVASLESTGREARTLKAVQK